MNTSRTYSAVKEQVKAKFSWKYAGGALGVAVVVLLLSLVQPWSTTAYELSDSGVWVSKGLDLGRVNSQVAQMDYVGDAKKGRKIQQGSEENGPLVVQGGRSVFLVANGGDSIEAPKPQEPTADQKPLAIPGVKELALGGGTGNDQVVVARTESEVFLVARGGALLRSSQQPLMKVGPKSQVAVGSGGTVVAYSPQDGKKEATLQYRELSSEDVRKETLSSEPGEGTTLTMVGEQVVLLDSDAERLLLPGSDAVELNGLTSPKVQLPGPQSDFVVIADKKELLKVNLKSGKPTTIYSADAVGTPVRPAVDADCVHGAWERVVVASCGGGEPTKADLDPAEDAGPWYFRTGGVTALLNSSATGNSWMVFDQNELQKVLWPEPEPDKAASSQEVETPPDRERNEPPEAICEDEGELGARKGKVTYLNVLANDKDPNRDPILVSQVSQPDGPKFEIAQGGRSIQIDTTSSTEENRTYEFAYQVSDGREESEEVKCKVQIVPAGQNNQPKKLTEKTVLAFDAVRNQQVSYDLLAHFIDPEGDPIILSEAQVDPASGDKVSFDPTGFIYFTSAGKTSTVTAFVQDVPPNQQGVRAEWPVQARVAAEPKPPTARNDVVEVVVNETKTVQPLLNDSDPNGDDLYLEGEIEEKGDKKGALDILPSDDPEKSFALKASQAGYYTLSYKVSDRNTDPVEGRITVKASPKDESSLVALNDVVIVNVGSTATVDLLANDSDASNGVLSVVDLVPPTPLQPPTPDPCSSQQLSGSVLNDFSTFQVVALDDAIAEKTCNFGYEITNSQGKKASAQISVVIVKRKLSNEPPEFIHPEPFTVRAKQVGVIPVGAFVQDPEGDPITVDLDKKQPLKAGSGQIYQSGNDLKYVAPQGPLAEPVVVHVLISDQLRAATPIPGSVKIQVIQAPNIPPVPKNVTVRVRAGQEISIPIPLVGLDEDWTPVELTGWERTNTDLLRGTPKVLDGSQTISYLAPENISSTQTDRFRYFVKDTDGGEGSALVTVQISPQEKNHSPIAVLDKVTARKGSPVWINPVSNDTDLDGDFLKLVEPYTAPPGCKAEPDEGRLKITAESNCTIGYSVSDYGQGDTGLVEKSKALGKITVTVVDEDFGLRPIARDDYATPDGDFATVNVLANDDDPDGLASDLTIDFGDDSKSISADDSPGTIKISLTKSPQRLQYSITDKDKHRAVAFVWVPSQLKNLPPVERPNHDPIIFKIGEPAKEIKLADYIIDPEGTELTFEKVSSLQSEEGYPELNKTISQGVVMFEPRQDTAGLGGLQVVAMDKGGESATIVLAIQIQPAANLPPSWINPNYCDKVIVEQGSKGKPEKSAQLKSLVFNAKDPDGKSGASLSFNKISESGPEGVEVNVTPEGNFTASASDAVAPGEIKKVSVILKDDEKAASAELKCSIVVGYTTDDPVRVRPGVQLVTKQGQAIKVEIASLLEQSGTGAKFVDTPSGQVGGTVQTSATTLTYTPGIDVAGDVNIPFTVKEEKVCQSTGLQCTATGNIVVLVTGRPTGLTPPTAVGGAESDAKIVLTYKEPDRNFDPSPVSYSVRSVQGNVTKDCGTSTICTVDAGDGVQNAIDYSFELTAKNATGESKPSLPSKPVQTDVKPGAPEILSLTEGDGQLVVVFKPADRPKNGISPTLNYTCNGGSTPVVVYPPATSCTLGSLKNGDTYKATVTTFTKNAENTSVGKEGIPFGPPIITGPILDWVNSDNGGMTLKASATVGDNGTNFEETIVVWSFEVSNGKKCSEIAAPDRQTRIISCPKTESIVATMTVTTKGGVKTASSAPYNLPAKPIVNSFTVTPDFKSLKVNATATGSGTSFEYSLDEENWYPTAMPFDLSATVWEPTDVYVRACSQEWPECGDSPLPMQGTAYGQASRPTATCDNPSDKGETSCTLSFSSADSNFKGTREYHIGYFDKDGKPYGAGFQPDSPFEVPCETRAEIYVRFNKDDRSSSETLTITPQGSCPVVTG